MSAPLLEVRELSADRKGRRVLDRVSFSMQEGEMLGIIGESGAGKSTLARAVARLIPVSCGDTRLGVPIGFMRWRGADFLALEGRALRAARRNLQIVFQDPGSSLDPRMTVGAIVSEPLEVHRLCGRREREATVAALLRTVRLAPELMQRHPHQLSGGQAQRVALARALATRPSLLIADEALSSLDASLQAEMANLLLELRQSLGLACLFITHDLRLAACLCDRVAVLWRGALVESGSPAALFRDPGHPATRALVEASRSVAAPSRSVGNRSPNRIGA
jgi:ABC-type glutathione transport system ATPase component